MTVLLVFLGLSGWTHSASGVEINNGDRITREAENAFKRIIALWKEEQYEELYEQGHIESQQALSKQDFVRLMQESNVRLQCCWATVQNMKGITRSPTEVHLNVTLGFEHFSPMGSETITSPNHRWKATSTFKEVAFLMSQEGDHWKIDLGDVLAACGYTLRHPQILKAPSP